MTTRFLPTALLLLLGCAHSDSFVVNQPIVGPFGTGTDLQLTFNVEQDYWPAWTQDGRGILYSFVTPGSTVRHRCLGLLPAAGGTRIWQLCDNRAVQGDSVSSYTGYALGSDGRLLFTSAVSDSSISGHTPGKNTLWLADTATPFKRTPLLTLPVILDGVPYSWLSEIVWTGDNTFLALAQDFTITTQPMPPCPFDQDSIFMRSGVVVSGTIAAGHATLQPITGTLGATGYSSAENGASVVFIMRNDMRLFKVAAGGGTATALSPPLGGGANQLLGVSCKNSACVVASDPVTLIGIPCVGVNAGAKSLYAVSLSSGSSQMVATAADIIVAPQISPVSWDVVMQVGGSFGHLQTIGLPSDANLHLLRAVVP